MRTPRTGQANRYRNPWPRIGGLLITALMTMNVVLLMRDSDPPPPMRTIPIGAEPNAAEVISPGPQRKARFGVFVGTDRHDLTEFERFAGRPVQDVVDYSARNTWADISDPDLVARYWKGTDKRLIYAVAMLPDTLKPRKDAAMRAGARGRYNQQFVDLAEHLVATGHENAVLRIGWECNLKNWAWGIKDARTYRQFFRQIVVSMRSVPGARFEIDWNVNNGYNPYDGTKYYPGDQYVDYVGVDAYDLDSTVYPYPERCSATCRLEIQQRAWNEVIHGGPRGLDLWSAFAARHRKPLTLPEWGLWDPPNHTGGQDNPFYIEQMHDFIELSPNHVAYAAYFNFDGVRDGTHRLARFPNSRTMFRRLFSD